MEPRAMGRWAPAIVAAVIFGVVGVAAASGGSGDKSPSADSIDESAFQPVVDETVDPLATEVADSSPEVQIEEPDTTVSPKVPLKRTLSKGLAGKDVKRVQTRLIELGFDPGEPDGVYGANTISAVWAFEKLVMEVAPADVKGRVTKKMWDRMQDDIVIKPKRPKGTRTHLEVYLPLQVAILFVDNKPRLITHISSGSGEKWTETVTIDPGEDGNENGTTPVEAVVSGESITPGGVYKFYRRYDPAKSPNGWREGRLGRMYKPVYFNYGIAVHGSGKVPNYPASHGCIRIPMHIAEYFPDLVEKGDQVFVFDGVKSPEYYGAKPPRFDNVEYNTTTTDKTATTKPTTTTVKPTTTAKPTTTKATTTTTTAPSGG